MNEEEPMILIPMSEYRKLLMDKGIMIAIMNIVMTPGIAYEQVGVAVSAIITGGPDE